MSQSAVNLEHGVNLSTNFGMKNCNELSDEIGLVIEHKNIIEIDNIDNVYCLTADSFITNKELFKYSIKEVQEKFVEEMEGFALAYVCKKENIAFNAVKYVSDDINKNNGGNDFIEILKKGIVAKKLVDILNIILLKYFI